MSKQLILDKRQSGGTGQVGLMPIGGLRYYRRPDKKRLCSVESLVAVAEFVRIRRSSQPNSDEFGYETSYPPRGSTE
jgi:hypothetical protein